VVQLPALRDRTDLDVVTQKILGNVCSAEKRVGVSHDVMQLFRRYKWPGNMRQLFNLLRTAVVMAECEGDIQIHHLPDDFLSDVQQINSAPSPQVVRHAMPEVSQAEASPADLYDPQTLNLENVAIDAIAQALRTCKGNVSAAAKMLGVSRNTIYRKKHLLPNDL
jgi:transcriptional regulator of acetoin/glycerol metabolism